jgi:hypothetical protein
MPLPAPLQQPPPPAGQSFPLKGGIGTHGEYWVNLRLVGAGGREFQARLQIDSGSSALLLLPPRLRQDHGARPANASSSSSSPLESAPSIPCRQCHRCDAKGDCPFSMEFGDGSTAYALSVWGKIVSLRVRGAGADFAVPVHLAANASGNLPTRVDGILGLSFAALDCTPTCVEPAWHGLGKAFRVEMGDRGGRIDFFPEVEDLLGVGGRRPPAVLRLPVEGNPRSYYAVPFSGVAVGNVLVHAHAAGGGGSGSGLAVVDSGTTLMILPPEQFDAVQRELQRSFCHLPGVCGVETVFQPGRCLARFHPEYPDLHLFFGPGALRVPPALYFFKVQSVYCLALQRGPASLRAAILGDALLRGFSTTFSPKHVAFASRNDSFPVDFLLPGSALVVPVVKPKGFVPSPHTSGDNNVGSGLAVMLVSAVVAYWIVRRLLRGSRVDRHGDFV